MLSRRKRDSLSMAPSAIASGPSVRSNINKSESIRINRQSSKEISKASRSPSDFEENFSNEERRIEEHILPLLVSPLAAAAKYCNGALMDSSESPKSIKSPLSKRHCSNSKDKFCTILIQKFQEGWLYFGVCIESMSSLFSSILTFYYV